MSPWRSRKFLVFAAGNTLNNVGDAVYATALPLLVYQLTGSLGAMAALAALNYVYLLLAPISGAVADRLGGGRLIVPALLVQAGLGALMTLLVLVHRGPVELLYVFGPLIEIAGGLYRAGWMAALPQVFPENAPRARAALSSSFVASTILGPLLVAALLGPLGFTWLLWLNVATFATPIVVHLYGVRAPAEPAVRREVPARITKDIAEGWNAVVFSRPLRTALLLFFPAGLLASAATSTLAVYVMRKDFNLTPESVSLVILLANAGALVGSTYASVQRRVRVGQSILLSATASVACLWLLPLQMQTLFIVGLILFRMIDEVAGIGFDMLIYTRVTPDLIGRVNGTVRLIRGIPATLSPLVVAAVAALMGTAGTFVLVAAATSVPLLWFLPRWSRTCALLNGGEEPDSTNAPETPFAEAASAHTSPR